MNLTHLRALFVKAGARRLYAKSLAENDNSKNQVYFGPGFQALNLFPTEGIAADSTLKEPNFKAKLNFGWLTESGAVSNAPRSQLILYPQYPEVRFSGFLKGCSSPPSKLMTDRQAGRVLFLAVTEDRKIVGFVVAASSEIACEFNSLGLATQTSVFAELSLPSLPSQNASKAFLLAELKRISEAGWIDSKQLGAGGVVKPCQAPQCGGFTLEAELGIPKNSVGEPDFWGWEVKQHAVPNFNGLGAAITLMTPEPTGGYYKEKGVEAFVRSYGYKDKRNRDDRMNFGGIHSVGKHQGLTGLTMELIGYDFENNEIVNPDGLIALVDNHGNHAASWAFSGLLAHWSKKHSKAVYVPSMKRTEPKWQYCYGPRVRLGEGTDSLKLLSALACGFVYYDPGIKLENASTKPAVKRRSQFRIASKNIAALYETMDTVTV
jgi:hypothetical protein